MQTTSLKRSLLASTFCLAAAASPALAQDAPAETDKGQAVFSGEALAKALKESKLIANARIRYEHADFGSLDENANALTFRLRLGAETGAFLNTKLLAEFDYVESLNDDFNSTRNGNTLFPVVADPEAIELNRLQLTNTSLPDTTVTIGRQRLIHDDSRFIGNVGFRQNEQTFDAVRIVNNSIGNLTLDATYFNQANRIFGDDEPAAGGNAGATASNFEGDNFLAKGTYSTPLGKLSAFAYILEIEEAGGNLSSQTFGARFWGGHKIGPGKLNYQLSYANQSDRENNTNDYNANFIQAEGIYNIGPVLAGGGLELLGGDNGVGFSTPFATLHKFNGFADVFLATPGAGLRDAYGKVGYNFGDIGPIKGLKFAAWYHDFNTDDGGIDIGEEVDLRLWGKIGNVALEVKYANYFTNNTLAGAPGQDVERLFLFATYAF